MLLSISQYFVVPRPMLIHENEVTVSEELWSKEGRLKARKHFTSVDNYILHTRYTEQMYINLQLSQPIFEVTELDTHWNRMPYQWRSGPDGKINHFLARTKFDMPRLEKTELSIWESS